MFRKLLCTVIVYLSFASAFAQEIDLSYYLPQDITYNPNIPTPKELLGYEVGEWHVSHDQLIRYMYDIADASDRITIEQHGRSYEGRPILKLYITHPDNHKDLDKIQAEHLKLADPSSSREVDISKMPAVLWMGYSIHGNEASGSNAALLVAYYLAAAQGELIEKQLKETVILFDPCYNPDGLNRFASWVNTHKGVNRVITDPYSREHQEAWPRGRTNHYWFDLNRDWLPVRHPESRARIAKFHEWKPNWLTDHHEMGTNATFFFQPGEPARNHPLTPKKVIEFAGKVAEYHAKALDEIGSLYYTQEGYDDFYYGKGSTYPDVNGGVGILFEQASSRGHAQDSENGVLRFPFAIRNQFTTSLSTLKGVHELRVQLLEYQRDFFVSALSEARSDPNKAYIFGDPRDKNRSRALADIIAQHDIQVYRLQGDETIGGKVYPASSSYVVPLQQRQYRLIKAMFETRTSFEDSLFYDISAWTLPMAFNLQYEALSAKSLQKRMTSIPFERNTPLNGNLVGGKSNYAYAFEWHDYFTPKALHYLQEAGLRTLASPKKFKIGGREYDRGTIIVPLQNQSKTPDEIHAMLLSITGELAIDVYSIETGLSSVGIDIGSRSMVSLDLPKILMPIGDGVSSYEAGEVWHLLDNRFDIPLNMVDVDDMGAVDLDKYNTLVMVNGRYDFSENTLEKIKRWVRAGGTIVGTKSAVSWLNQQGLVSLSFKSGNSSAGATNVFEKRGSDRGAQVIGGAIFHAEADLSHPLMFGYSSEHMYLFRNHTRFVDPKDGSYDIPLLYAQNPLASGYISEENTASLAGTAAAKISSMGRGKVIALVDNPNFRAFWYGTNKLFLNAIFLSEMM